MVKTLRELEEEYLLRKSRVDDLVKERMACSKRIIEIDSMIEEITGEPVTKYLREEILSEANEQFGTEKEDNPVLKLEDVIAKVLNGNKEGMTLREISRSVLNAGYKTKSKNFDNVVYQSIHNSQNIQKIGTRRYALK